MQDNLVQGIYHLVFFSGARLDFNATVNLETREIIMQYPKGYDVNTLTHSDILKESIQIGDKEHLCCHKNFLFLKIT